MKKDIVLVRPARYGYRSGFISAQEPINLCYLAAYLERAGFDVEIWDLEQQEASLDEFISRLKDVAPALVGFSCYTPNISAANKFACLLKSFFPKIITVVGGPHSTALPKETLKEFKGFDIVVMGEGEETLLSLAKCVTLGNDYRSINGISFREESEIIQNYPAPLIKDIDSLPHPARNLLNWSLYRNMQHTRGIVSGDKKITSIYTSRGCPGRCIFCAVNLNYSGAIRLRSADSILSEVEECLNKYNIGHFIIQDDTFNLQPNRLYTILNGFKKLGIESWSCDARVDLVTREMLFSMADSGCRKISFGVESGSPRILALIKKGITIDQAKNAVRWSREAGIECVELTFIIGSHPDETVEDVRLTRGLLKDLKPDIVFVSVVVPYPGTEIYNIMKSKGLIYNEDWENFLMFSSSVPVWRTEHFTSEDLVNIQRKILKEFYLRPAYIFKKLLKLKTKSELSYWVHAGVDLFRSRFIKV